MKKIYTLLLALSVCIVSSASTLNITIYINNTSAGTVTSASSAAVHCSADGSTWSGAGFGFTPTMSPTSIPAGGTGVMTASINDSYPYNAVTFSYRINNGASIATPYSAWVGGSSPVYYYDITGGWTNQPSCTTNFTYTVKNTDVVPASYAVAYDNAPAGTPVLDYDELQPGQSTTLRSGDIKCSDASHVHLYKVTGAVTTYDTNGNPSTVIDQLNGGTYDDTGIAPNSGTTVPVTSPTASTGTPSTNILWSADTTNNDNSGIVAAVKDGSSVLYDAITKLGQQAHADSLILQGDVKAINTSGSGGGGASITNYALETTLAAQYDLFTNALKNGQTYTNTVDYYKAQAANNNTGSNVLAGLTGPSTDPLTADQNHVGDASGLSAWTISVPYLGVGSIDCNPMHYPFFVDISTWCRAFVKWAVLLGILVANARSLLLAINASGTWRQSTASGQAIFGVNANLITALAMAAAISAVMLAIPYFASSQLTAYLTQLSVNPFSSMSGSLGVAFYLADQFFPLALIVAAPVAIFGFQMSLQAQVWGVQTVVRFLVG